MKRNITCHHALFFLLLALSMGCFLGCGGSEVIGSLGGSEVVGRVTSPGNVSLNNATIRVLSIDTTLDTAENLKFETRLVAEVLTDIKGNFKFDSLPFAAYVLDGTYRDDSLILPPLVFYPDTLQRKDLGALVMKVPGAIRGVVISDTSGPADQIIFCHIAGTSYMATVDQATGQFVISAIPPDTVYQLSIAADGYSTVVKSGIAVTSGETTLLQDTIFLKISPKGPPTVAPTGLAVTYDTARGVATLLWNSVAIEDVVGYRVYRSINGKENEMRVYGGNTLIDTLITDTAPLTVLYQVAAYDGANEGPRSAVATLNAVPPAWLRVNLAIKRIGTTQADSAVLQVAFASHLSFIESVTWWADSPDSILKEAADLHTQSGYDTLQWKFALGKKTLFVTVVDTKNGIWTDSIDASSLLPIDIWGAADSLNNERRYAGICSLGGKVYVFGGCKEKISMTGSVSSAGVKTVEVFDPAIGSWSGSAARSMNVARQKAAYAVVGGALYVLGGTDGQNDYATIERFDTVGGSWTIVTTMPRSLVGASATVVNGEIYITGGVTGTKEAPELLTTISAYNPATGVWRDVGVMATARQFHQAITIDAQIYILGGLGYDTHGDSVCAVRTVECFDPHIGSMVASPFSALSTPRYRFGAAALGKKIVVIGGLVGVGVDEQPVNTVEMYDVTNGGVTRGAAMPVAREGIAVSVLQGRVFVVGGSESGGSNQKSTSAVSVYYPK